MELTFNMKKCFAPGIIKFRTIITSRFVLANEKSEEEKKRRMLIYSRGKKFIDWKKVRLKSGDGGCGCVSFVHSRDHKGGPNGGDGGNGGSIFFQGDHNYHHLTHLKHRYVAESGINGKHKNRHGHNGKNLVIKVPVGTCIRCCDTNEMIADIVTDGQMQLISKGGKKGLGNVHFRSPWNVRPTECTEGQLGEEMVVEVELKSIADVGLIGFPNAGKSTLLRCLSNATPKVAAYPFTTLKPNIGVVQYSDNCNVSVADIPGLIEGAHKNRGLGHIFLRHVERCKGFLYVIDASADDVLEMFHILQKEVEIYQKDLTELPCALVANKIDLVEDKSQLDILNTLNIPVLQISAKYNLNIEHVRHMLMEMNLRY